MWIVYKTTNIHNGKIYVGVHGQSDGFGPFDFDGYLGSGNALKQAIKKYGATNFSRQTIKYFGSPEDAFLLESQIVTPEFAQSPHTYNLRSGGRGGTANLEAKAKMSASHIGKKHSEESKLKRSKALKGKPTGWQPNDEQKAKISAAWLGKRQSADHIKKRTATRAETQKNLYDWKAINADFFAGMKSYELRKKHQLTTSILYNARKNNLFVGMYDGGGNSIHSLSNKWRNVQADYDEGMHFGDILTKYNLTKANLSYARKNGLFVGSFSYSGRPLDSKSELIRWNRIQEDFISGFTYTYICTKYDLSYNHFTYARNKGLFVGKFKSNGTPDIKS